MFKNYASVVIAVLLFVLGSCKKEEVSTTPAPRISQIDTVFVIGGTANALYCHNSFGVADANDGILHYADTATMIRIHCADTLVFMDIVPNGDNIADKITMPILRGSTPFIIRLPSLCRYELRTPNQLPAFANIYECSRQ